MRHAVADFGAFGVVETVERADQIAGDAADAVERLVLVMISQLDLTPDRNTCRAYLHDKIRIRWDSGADHT